MGHPGVLSPSVAALGTQMGILPLAWGPRAHPKLTNLVGTVPTAPHTLAAPTVAKLSPSLARTAPELQPAPQKPQPALKRGTSLWGDINSGPWAGGGAPSSTCGLWDIGAKNGARRLGSCCLFPVGVFTHWGPLCAATPKDEGLLPTPSICPGSQKRGHCRPRRRFWN